MRNAGVSGVYKAAELAFLWAVACGALWAALSFLHPEIGAGDFRPYWSSTYLFRSGQDFNSLTLMDRVERDLTGWNSSFTMMAWFAPTGNLVLLPFTFLPFFTAVQLWLLLNLGIVLWSTKLLWKPGTHPFWAPYAVPFLFSMTLVSLVVGQINTLEILGLALFGAFLERGRPAWAGASLVLTTIKPHLVILTLPLLLLDLARSRQWRALAGFGGALACCAALLFFLNSEWPSRFVQLVSSGMGSIRQPPNLVGLLVEAGETQAGKWLWLAVLIAAVWLWWKYGKGWDRKVWIDLSLIAGLMIAPAGWSYDQILLLIPVVHILEWIQAGVLKRSQAGLVLAVLVVSNLASFLQSGFANNDVWFFWLPWVIGATYLWVWRAANRPSGAAIQLPG